MGNKRFKNRTFGNVKRKNKYYGPTNSANDKRKKNNNSPKSLVILCERAIKKYKLIRNPAPKNSFTPPENFSVVGGKPLRKRSEEKYNYKVTETKGESKRPSRKRSEEKYNYKVTETKGKSKRFNPKSLAKLCRIVIQEYNLLPESEELLISKQTPLRKRSRSQSNVVEKRLRGRPRKSVPQEQNDALISIQIKRPRGRPPKDPNAASYLVKYSSTQLQEFAEQPISNVRIKEELDLQPDIDPLRDEEDDFTVVIKEEAHDSEDDEITHEVYETPVVSIPQATPQATVIKPEAHLQVPGPSRIEVTRTPKYMTIVMDEYQIFANSIAEQLRALPANRALLLQLDIQSMIDNEKQLISDEH